MKVEGIIISCPFIKRANFNSDCTHKVIAPSINSYFSSNNDVFKASSSGHRYKQVFLIAIKFGDDLFILQKFHKSRKLIKVVDKLSDKFGYTFVLIKALRNNEDDIELEIIHSTDSKTADSYCEEDISDDSDEEASSDNDE